MSSDNESEGIEGIEIDRSLPGGIFHPLALPDYRPEPDARELFGSDNESGGNEGGGIQGIDIPPGPTGIFGSDNDQLTPDDYDGRGLFGSDDEGGGIEGIEIPPGPTGIFGSNSSHSSSSSSGGHGLFGSDNGGNTSAKTSGLGDERTTKYSTQYNDRTLPESIKGRIL